MIRTTKNLIDDEKSELLLTTRRILSEIENLTAQSAKS